MKHSYTVPQIWLFVAEHEDVIRTSNPTDNDLDVGKLFV